MMKTRKTIAFAAMLACVAWVAYATDFTGWSGAGNPDLASSATWNLESRIENHSKTSRPERLRE